VGKVEVSNKHVLGELKGSFKISRKLQELMCLVGQSHVFEDGEELFLKMMGIQVNRMQIQRVSKCYGEYIEEEHMRYIETGKSAPLVADKEKDTVYVMTDGSMLFTREEDWKEIKVGRVFAQKDCVKVHEKRSEIVKSQYVCHLGDAQEFQKKFEYHIDDYKKKVCIADGATYIWNWADAKYPEMVQILDYYHAVEKLSDYAKEQIPDIGKRKQWMDKQEKLLLNNEAATILQSVQKQQGHTPQAETMRKAVVSYYGNNLKRMQYKTYKEAGYMIGSGPIESSHRNIVQQRLKLSGQRWTIEGAQRIVNLRAYQKSNRWEEVVEIIKIAA
jgi:hypothetical protein